MFSDSYVEQVLKAKPDGTFYLKMFISSFFVVLGIISFPFIGSTGFVFAMLGICLFFCFFGDSNMEYEYTLTNGGVDVAAIYNASKRKEKKHFELEKVTMIVPKGSLRISQEKFAKKYDFTSKRAGDLIIALVLEEKGNKQLILMEPDEKTMAHIKSYAKDKMYDL